MASKKVNVFEQGTTKKANTNVLNVGGSTVSGNQIPTAKTTQNTLDTSSPSVSGSGQIPAKNLPGYSGKLSASGGSSGTISNVNTGSGASGSATNNYFSIEGLKQRLSQTGNWSPSASVTDAKNRYDQLANNPITPWDKVANGKNMYELYEQINSREPFKYDLNADMLYQQYKDNYMAQGNLAMQDAMGQAAALTGGYGNSYAATVGNQAYQQSVQQLNNKVPELYQLALQKYQAEGDDLYRRYGMATDQYARDYGEYRDQISDYNTALDRAANMYNAESERDYSRFKDRLEYDTSNYWNMINQQNTENALAYQKTQDKWQQDFATAQQKASEDQFAKNLALEQAKLDFTMSQAKGTTSSGSSGGSSGGSSKKKSSSSSKKTSGSGSGGSGSDTKKTEATSKTTKLMNTPTLAAAQKEPSIKYINDQVKAGKMTADEAKKLKKKLGLL